MSTSTNIKNDTCLLKKPTKKYKLKAIGKRYGKLVVIDNLQPIRTPSGQVNRICLCKCDCGKTKKIRFSHLNHGKTRSCGCMFQTLGGKSNTDIGRLYHGIKSRTSDYHSERHLYFDKGIKMCDEWQNNFESFEKWCKQNGYKKGLHIDRKDGNKGYSPGNCRFVTPKVNANNRGNTFYVNYKGKKWALKLLLQDLGYPNKYYTVRTRILRGWKVKDALFKKPNPNRYGLKVRQMDLDGNIIRIFNTISEAGKYLGKCSSGINKVCNGKAMTAYGFKWELCE